MIKTEMGEEREKHEQEIATLEKSHVRKEIFVILKLRQVSYLTT